MNEPITLQSYMKAEREVEIEEGRRSFRVHAVVFVVANIVMILLNLFVLAPEFYWFPYALIGWGTALVVHYLVGYRRMVAIVDGRQSRIETRAKG